MTGWFERLLYHNNADLIWLFHFWQTTHIQCNNVPTWPSLCLPKKYWNFVRNLLWAGPAQVAHMCNILQNDILLLFVSYNVIKNLGEISNLEMNFRNWRVHLKTLNEIELSKILAMHDGACLLPFNRYSLRSMKILVPKIRRLNLAEHYAAFCSETNMFEQMFEDWANTLYRKQNWLLPFAFSSCFFCFSSPILSALLGIYHA